MVARVISIGLRIGLGLVVMVSSAALLRPMLGGNSCRLPSLRGERRDAATILQLERSWSVAYLQGDTGFERCLLSPQFTEIMRTGQVKGIADELGFAAANIGLGKPLPVFPVPQVLILGNDAVAYGIARGSSGATCYADHYVWDGRSWHVLIAQQTPLEGA